MKMIRAYPMPLIEAASATTLAAVMDHRERIGGKNIALVISGGNIDGKILKELLDRY